MEDMLIYQKAQKIVCTLIRERFYFSFKNGDRQVKLQMGPLLFYLQKTDLTLLLIARIEEDKSCCELYRKSAWHCKRGNRWTALVITIRGKTKNEETSSLFHTGSKDDVQYDVFIFSVIWDR